MDADQSRRIYLDREIQLFGPHALKLDGTSTLKSDYVPHPIEPRPIPSPPPPRQPLPFEGTTTYGSNFGPHPIERPKPYVYEYRPEPIPFDGTTTYQNNFVPHPLEHKQPPAAPYQRQSLPFEGASFYKTDFHPHPLPKQSQPPASYPRQSLPFEGSSTYKDAFQPLPIEPRPQPEYQPKQPLPFQGSTTYADTFKPIPIQARNTAPPVEYKGSGLKFEGTTETMDSYRAWAIDPANYVGSTPPPMRPSLPFDGTTTHKEMFKGWQLPPKRPSLGVQMLGDLAYILIPAGAPVPATGRQLFTTTRDNQTEIVVLVLEGNSTHASKCNVLGHFQLSGLRPSAKGMAKIEISMHVDASGVLNVTARDLDTQRHEQWLQEGHLTAHVNYQA